MRRGTRKRDTKKLASSFAAQKADDDGNAPAVTARRARATTTRVKMVPESPSDEEDEDYDLPDLVEASDSEDSDSDDEMEIDNEEVSTQSCPVKIFLII